ncbi:hypothetical protein GCM10020258_31510 [Sphingomonas yabuuchiae]
MTGMVNVLSGDARNSGALDPSIRGIQGPGRVPVVIDGTEQALTVWRGYNGASNRAYVDPNLISGLQVLRGPTDKGNIRSSTGGTVVINTLDADDVLQPGRIFGLDLKLEGGNNSTDPRLPTLLTGRDYRTVPGFPRTSPSFALNDPYLRVVPRTGSDNHFLSFGDRAVRVAGAVRIEGWTSSRPMPFASGAIISPARPGRTITSSRACRPGTSTVSAGWRWASCPAMKCPTPPVIWNRCC